MDNAGLHDALKKSKTYQQTVNAGTNGQAQGQGLPVIPINADLTGMVDNAEAALMQLPGPVVYQRARMLCRVAPAGESPRWLQRPADAPIIVRADPVSLREYSGQSAWWVKYDKRSKEWSPVLPPPVVFETLAARVTWKFPHLEGVICAPTLRPDGVLLQQPGYDQDTGLYLDFNGVRFPPVPEHPTKDDAIAALTALHEPFRDFPFAHAYGLSAALAAVLSLIGRYAIPGPVPAFPVRSNTAGSGKGLLVDTIATIATGRIAPHWAQIKEEDEDRKRLLTIAMSGDSCVHIDNVTLPFGNGALDSALTTMSVKDRLLGMNQSLEAAWLAVMFVSGNNLMFAGDMARRVVPVDLDPRVEKPEERTGFQHARLLEWVRQERPRLVVAALIALTAFFAAGCPKQPGISEFGAFEAWSDLVRHALIWADWPDPCEGRKNIQAESDGTYEALSTLLTC